MNASRPSGTDIAGRLNQILGDVPFVRLRSVSQEPTAPDTGFDLSFDVTANGTRWKLLIEVKSSGEPRIARGAIQRILATAPKAEGRYGVLAAPYIGEQTQKICKQAGVGFIDLAGNCRLVFDKIFVERRGFPKPEAERRPLRSLFSPKASRILRVLFEAPKQPWQVQRLAREARVSLGLAAKVKQRLLDLEYGLEEPEGIRLAKPEELLAAWAAALASRKRSTVGVYAAADLPEIEEALRGYCTENGVRYAFTQFSGAARVAPFTRYTRGAAYVQADPASFVAKIGWKIVDTGANFTLPWPFDEGAFYGARTILQDRVVSDIQLYLDLIESKGRGEEAATAILEQKLRPRW
jgi:Transcriptional regulator, AbiEi antitoxin, Type IV TA system